MKKIYIYGLVFMLYLQTAMAQGTQFRGVYIDHFTDILGNTTKEDALLQYAQDSSFNYLALYDLHALDLTNASTANTMASFIKRARDTYGLTYIGAVGESYSSFSDNIGPYNMNRSDDHEKFNVFNLEFEFWTSSSVNPGGYYCQQYLQQANCNCDTSGGFKFFIKQMHQIDSLAHVQQVISETYLGWFNQGQASQIQQNVDRVLLHAYRTGSSSLYSYSKLRMEYLASNNSPIEIAPIFSAEPIFMGPWLESHSETEAFDQYATDFANETASWKQYVTVTGYQWFDWKYMPKPAPATGPFSPVITSSTSNILCSGDTATLTATAGDSYHWSNGATTRSIVTPVGGTFTCDVSLNGTVHTTPSLTLTERTSPTVSVNSTNTITSDILLTATSVAGSGNITSYQWKINSANITGANASTYTATTSGSYTVAVTNTYGCSVTSAMHPVSIAGSCFASVPNGLNSTLTPDLNQEVTWAPGQTGDSIIIRYHPDSSATYEYIRMLNTGQTSYVLTNLLPSTLYSWRVKTMCGGTSSAYSSKSYFTTPNVVGVKPELAAKSGFILYPNPAKGKVYVGYNSSTSTKGEIVIADINGRIVKKENVQFAPGDNNITLMLSEYKNGVYTVSVKSENNIRVEKLIIDN